MTSGNPIHGRPTAAELVAAVANFLETQVQTSGRGADELATATYALRIVERELLDDSVGDADARDALAALGFSEEAQLAAAIRNGDLDHRAHDVTSYLRTVVNYRLAISHPGYQVE
jgi:hypothetical protein